MKKTRSTAVAIVGLTLTATSVLAAAPATQMPADAAAISSLAKDHAATGGANENHGGAVSTLAKGTDDTSTTTTTDTTTDAGAQGTHGAAVSVVAQDETAVGGPNDNHGGAVSLIARGTGQAATHGKSGSHKPSLVPKTGK